MAPKVLTRALGSNPVRLASIVIASCLLTAVATAYSLAYGYAAVHPDGGKVWPDVPLTYLILFAAFYAVSLLVTQLLASLTTMDGQWAFCVSGGIVLFTFQLILRTLLIPADIISVVAYIASGFVIGSLIASSVIGIDRVLRSQAGQGR
jgi:hypothetical protein